MGSPDNIQALLHSIGLDRREVLTRLVFLHGQYKAAEQNLHHSARHDRLTGLTNRQGMLELLSAVREHQHNPAAQHVALLLIDLDRFKLINNSLGHSSGDQVLQEVARRLKRCLRPGDQLARIGGDEFVALLNSLARQEDAERIAQRMLDELHLPLQLDGLQLSVRASIGIAGLGETGNADDLLRAAELAMYRAKDAGKGRIAHYSIELQQRATRRQELESALAQALERGEFDLHFQPICRLEQSHSRVAGVEALLRWRYQGHWVAPEEFIPILEESGEILAVGEWALLHAAWQCMCWQRVQPGLYCTVNLSSQQLKVSDFASRVARVLSETGLPASCLILEITESQLLEDSVQTLACLHKLASLGVRLALDDFGTGYCSLSYLKRFPLHILKVDRSFICGTCHDEELTTISRAIIKLGHNLNMVVVAEGVELNSQLSFLRSEGCKYAQGYLFSKPQAAWQLDRLFLQQPAYLNQNRIAPQADCCI